MSVRDHSATLMSPPGLAVTVGALLVMGHFTPLAQAAPLVSLIATTLAAIAAGPVLAWVLAADAAPPAIVRASR